MYARDHRDIMGGGALVLIGVSAAVYALLFLQLGSLSRMGPGMFPIALSSILIGLGLAILIPALFRSGEMPSVDLRSLVAVLASILVFAILIRPFGMIPAIAALVLVVSRADSKLSPIGTVSLTACLSLGATLVFKFGLGMPVAAIAAPW